MSSALDRTEPRFRRCHDGPGRHLEVAGRQIALDRDILHVGSEGLGALRAAPAVGAALTALILARRPLKRHVGTKMFACVALFGLATVVFGESRVMWLSLASLFVLGGADMISVYVRSSLIQLHTPDEMRGRVSAVSGLFISALKASRASKASSSMWSQKSSNKSR